MSSIQKRLTIAKIRYVFRRLRYRIQDAINTKVDMLKRVETMVGDYKDVMVLCHDLFDDYYDESDDDDSSRPSNRLDDICSDYSDESDDSDVGLWEGEWCAKRGWKFVEDVRLFVC